MNPDFFAYAALICFALGALTAVAAFKFDAFRNSRWQLLLVAAGAAAKTAAIGITCKASDSHFFNSFSEIYGLMAWALALSYLLALLVSGAYSLGALVLPLVSILMALSLFSSRSEAPLNVPPNSLFAVHILSAFFGYALFLTACGASVLYLEQRRLLKHKNFGVLFRDLPSLERLERLEIFCSRLGLVVFTVALAAGAKLAQVLDVPFWFEFKFLAAQTTWLIFGALVAARALRWISGRAAAKCVLAGAGLVLLTFALSHPLTTRQAGPRTGDLRVPGASHEVAR